ncbi:hypothetical protein BpHYR1_041525 [Brachionus plicatilis]|uniref:Uncharacterized protein n=1 Tax=Brachionus plicatilis TaxID=10195 RepID=A0A3M7S3P0_BRAPC|nr:hypothetical protein BpHYR1_041525 [Brachionus plicatilis]
MQLNLIYRHPIINVPSTPDEYADQIKFKLQKAYEKVRQNKNVRIRRMRLNYDRHVYATEFKRSDLVWVRNDRHYGGCGQQYKTINGTDDESQTPSGPNKSRQGEKSDVDTQNGLSKKKKIEATTKSSNQPTTR